MKFIIKKCLISKPGLLVLYFNKNIFSPLFYEMKEAVRINEFFQNAARGISINGKTKEILAGNQNAFF